MLTRRRFIAASAAALGAQAFAGPLFAAPGDKQNVLLIMVDDHNDWFAPGVQTPAHTPNLKRWSKEMVAFSNAYCAAPACGPSRAALLTGAAPHKSGVYYNNQAYRRAHSWIKKVENLPQRFLKSGYRTASFGKVAHLAHQKDDAHCWSKGLFVPFSKKGDKDLAKRASDTVNLKIGQFEWGKLPDSWDRGDPRKMQQDTQNVERFKKLLAAKSKTPFFCGLGIYRPHLHWYVPKRYFDLYPLEKIETPESFKEDDLNDIPDCARWLAMRKGVHRVMAERNMWKKAMQAYLASITYADDMIGRALDALKASKHYESTTVIICGDNGWHLGEKFHWSKFALWEKACRVPMLVRAPGLTPKSGAISHTPVSLLDIYPTLVDHCGVGRPKGHQLDGKNLTPVLKDPKARREAPVLTSHGSGCHAVRDERYRYIQYRNGTEELYDHQNDPHEWKNLAAEPSASEAKRRLARFVPTKNAPNVPFQGSKRTKGKESDKGWDLKVFEEGFKHPTSP